MSKTHKFQCFEEINRDPKRILQRNSKAFKAKIAEEEFNGAEKNGGGGAIILFLKLVQGKGQNGNLDILYFVLKFNYKLNIFTN